MIKDIILSLIFFLGVLVAFALGYGMNANFESSNVLSILIASGIVFGSIFVVTYRELRK